MPASRQTSPKSKRQPPESVPWRSMQLDEIRPSSRIYPYIDFGPNREIGNEVLTRWRLPRRSTTVKVLDNVSFIVGHNDKIAFVGGNELAKTTFLRFLPEA